MLLVRGVASPSQVVYAACSTLKVIFRSLLKISFRSKEPVVSFPVDLKEIQIRIRMRRITNTAQIAVNPGVVKPEIDHSVLT